MEHMALLFILDNVNGLKNNIDKIYNFELKQLNLNYNDKINGFDFSNLYLSSSELTMLKAGINLFNSNEHIDLIDCFAGLDFNNQLIILEAIKIRFNI